MRWNVTAGALPTTAPSAFLTTAETEWVPRSTSVTDALVAGPLPMARPSSRISTVWPGFSEGCSDTLTLMVPPLSRRVWSGRGAAIFTLV